MGWMYCDNKAKLKGYFEKRHQQQQQQHRKKIVYTITTYRTFCSALAHYIRSFYLSIYPLAIASLFRGYCTFSDSFRTIKAAAAAALCSPIPLYDCVIDSRCNRIRRLNQARFTFTAVMNESTYSKHNQLNQKFKTWRSFPFRSAWEGCQHSSIHLSFFFKKRATKNCWRKWKKIIKPDLDFNWMVHVIFPFRFFLGFRIFPIE